MPISGFKNTPVDTGQNFALFFYFFANFFASKGVVAA